MILNRKSLNDTYYSIEKKKIININLDKSELNKLYFIIYIICIMCINIINN